MSILIFDEEIEKSFISVYLDQGGPTAELQEEGVDYQLLHHIGTYLSWGRDIEDKPWFITLASEPTKKVFSANSAKKAIVNLANDI